MFEIIILSIFDGLLIGLLLGAGAAIGFIVIIHLWVTVGDFIDRLTKKSE